MYFSYLFWRLRRRSEWIRALECEESVIGFFALCKANARIIFQNYAEIAECTEKIRENASPEITQTALEKISFCCQKLENLLPFASSSQRKTIADAKSTAQYARSIAPRVRKKRPEEICYYAVYIPTLDGQFYYLATESYRVGDIVAIPFGKEDKIIFGIVRETFCEDYRKMPLPLWKMKYIDSKAPQAIVDEYRRQLKKAEQE